MLDVLSALAALATVGTFLLELFDRIRNGKRARPMTSRKDKRRRRRKKGRSCTFGPNLENQHRPRQG